MKEERHGRECEKERENVGCEIMTETDRERKGRREREMVSKGDSSIAQ